MQSPKKMLKEVGFDFFEQFPLASQLGSFR
jgi:hypothetical protein